MRLARSIVLPARQSRPAAPHPEALRSLYAARQAFARGAFHDALDFFEAALTLDKTIGLALFGKALCLVSLGQADAAAETLAEALDTSEDALRAALALAKQAANAKDASTAVALLSVLVQADPSYRDAARKDRAFAGMQDHPLFLQAIGDL